MNSFFQSTATGSYSPIQMTFVKDVTMQDGSTWDGNTTVEKTWEVSTTTGWPDSGVSLVCVNPGDKQVAKTPLAAAAKDSLVRVTIPIYIPEYSDKKDSVRVTFRVVDSHGKPLRYDDHQHLILWAEFRVHPFATGSSSSAALTTEEKSEENTESKPVGLTLPTALAALRSTNAEERMKAIVFVRKCLSKEDAESVATAVISQGGLPLLVALLDEQQGPKVQFEALWALTNVGSTSRTEALCNVGTGSVDAIPALIRCLGMPEPSVREQAIWALGNIAGHNHVLRNKLVSAPGCVASVAVAATAAKLETRRTAVWTLSNFVRGKPQPEFEQVQALIPVLDTILASETDDDVLRDAMWALNYLTDGTNQRISNCLERFSRCDPIARLVASLSTKSLQVPSLRTIGNICSGSEAVTQRVVDSDFLSVARLLLGTNSRQTLRKEALWTLSNITAGTKLQAQAVVDAGLIGPVLKLMKSADHKLRSEATWVISNLSTNSPQAGTPGMMSSLADVLQKCSQGNSQVGDKNRRCKTMIVAMEGLTNFLKAQPTALGSDWLTKEIADRLLEVSLSKEVTSSDINRTRLNDVATSLQHALNNAMFAARAAAAESAGVGFGPLLPVPTVQETVQETNSNWHQWAAPKPKPVPTTVRITSADALVDSTSADASEDSTSVDALADSAMAEMTRILGEYTEKQAQKRSNDQKKLQQSELQLVAAVAAKVKAQEETRRVQEENSRLSASVIGLEAKVRQLEQEKEQMQNKLSTFYKSMSDMFERS